jgi:hypothetical protein
METYMLLLRWAVVAVSFVFRPTALMRKSLWLELI